MVLHSRLFAKAAAAAPQPRPQPVRPANAAKPPQILQSGHAPAQLSFCFHR